MGKLPKNGALGQFADLRGSLPKNREWFVCFFVVSVDTPMHTMTFDLSFKVSQRRVAKHVP